MRHVEFADVLKGFGCGQAWISASGNRRFCFIGTSAGTAQADGWISAEGQTLAFSSKGAMEGPASMTILRDAQCETGDLSVEVIGLEFAIARLRSSAKPIR